MILGILQARISSSRLPGKVLLPILGKPMIVRQIERLRRARRLDALVVATSTDPSDDPLQQICEAESVECFRGSLDDVLDRFYQAARSWRAEQIVRLTGDCPLIDPALIDRVIQYHMSGEFDYSALGPRYPDGLDIEAMRFAVLETAWREATIRSQREHVTLFIPGNPDRFRIASFCDAGQPDLSALRWTVDEPADFEFARSVYEALYPTRPCFSTQDILALLESNPALQEINRGIARNEGLQKSLRDDAPIKRQKDG